MGKQLDAHASTHLLAGVPPKPAKERILAAATRIFARDGLDGATTRAIAQEAGVNEVTLFRVFGSKKKLLAEVVKHSFTEQTSPSSELSVTASLRDDLKNFFALYEARLVENMAMIRTMIGDLQRHREHELQVLKSILQPLRVQLISRIEAARKTDVVRREIDPAIAADQLMAMIFTSVLKSSRPHMVRDYSVEDYVNASVDLMVNGLGKISVR